MKDNKRRILSSGMECFKKFFPVFLSQENSIMHFRNAESAFSHLNRLIYYYPIFLFAFFIFFYILIPSISSFNYLILYQITLMIIYSS